MWRAAKNRLKRELGLTPHIAVVAKAITRSQLLPVGVDQNNGIPMVTLTNTMTTIKVTTTVPVTVATHIIASARISAN